MSAGRSAPRRGALRASLSWRLLALLLLIFATLAACFAIVANELVAAERARQLRDAESHFAARTAILDKAWLDSAYAVRQQIEIWLADGAEQPAAVRDARLRALVLTQLDQADYVHAVIIDGAGLVRFRFGTRSQDQPALPESSGPSGLGWVYSRLDQTVYRTVSGPLRYADAPARLLLYVPIDNALLGRLLFPGTTLRLLHAGQVTASATAGALAGASQQARLSLAWDKLPGAPELQVGRSFEAPLSTAELMGLGLSCGAAFVLASWMLIGRWASLQARRLDELQHATTEFAERPELGPTLMTRLQPMAAQNDEFGALARHLLEMMHSIELGRAEQARARATLAELNTDLERRVAERTRELELARDEALAAARAKEQFLSTMSHEIRTPMNGMLGALDLLTRAEPTPLQARYIDIAATSGAALLDVINEILDYAKIGAGRMQLAHDPIDVLAIARSVTTLFSAAADRKGLTLRLDAGAGLSGWRLGDAVRLRQVLMNLVGNAVKFTQRGEIVIRVARGDGHGAANGDGVRFEVRDSGPGVEASQQARIFEPFVQADHPSRRREGGTGLGLAICRDLVRAMGGELGLRSAPGHGACFGFTLPLVSVGATAVPLPGRADNNAPERPTEVLQGRVLLVEDNPVNRLIGGAMLEKLGLEVVHAEQGEEALSVMAGTPLSLVLMDCQMPVLDGYEATQRWRDIEREQARDRLPVIAFTANALSGDVARCFAAGMDGHLAKPFTLAQLRAAISPWLASPSPSGTGLA